MPEKKVNQLLSCSVIKSFGLSGQSVIEVIVAVSILVIIAGGAVVTLLGSFNTIRLAREETMATFFATTGLEAVESIKNNDWENLETVDCSAGCGLNLTGDDWELVPGSDDPQGDGKFNRQIFLTDIFRDQQGEVVDSGGVLDVESKKVSMSVSWNFTPTRNLKVEMTGLLTDWQKVKGQASDSQSQVSTCQDYCLSLGFTGGICRQNQQQCSLNGEEYQFGGNQYCLDGALIDTCCCQ